MNAQEIIERIMTAHWDLASCPCWVCQAGYGLKFAAREQYLATDPIRPVPIFGWEPNETYKQGDRP